MKKQVNWIPFGAGPHTIYEIDPIVSTVIIELSKKKKKMRVHVNRLKVYQSGGEYADHDTYGKIN